MIPKDEWEWFGNAGHFICGFWCRFHLCTKIGDFLVSTVGEYVPMEGVREIQAEIRGLQLEGKRGSEARLWSYLKENGYEEIGCDRLYETMVFRAGEPCTRENCNCGLPELSSAEELVAQGYNDRGAAARGHIAICARVAAGEFATTEEVT